MLSSQTEPIYSPSHIPSPRSWTLYVALVYRFNGLHLRKPCKYMDYYSFTDPHGMEGWVVLVGWPIVDSYPQSGYLSTIDRAQGIESLLFVCFCGISGNTVASLAVLINCTSLATLCVLNKRIQFLSKLLVHMCLKIVIPFVLKGFSMQGPDWTVIFCNDFIVVIPACTVKFSAFSLSSIFKCNILLTARYSLFCADKS